LIDLGADVLARNLGADVFAIDLGAEAPAILCTVTNGAFFRFRGLVPSIAWG
jgi:hypothetical protein